MSSHGPTPSSRSHARPGLRARLLSLVKGHGDLPEAPALDLQDHGDGMDVADALRAQPAPPWTVASQPPQPDALDDGAWWGDTRMDNPPVHHRPYVPDPLGQFPRAVPLPDPGPLADLRTSVIFRDTVRSVFVRQEEARGFHAPQVPWDARYAGLYRARTGLPVAPGLVAGVEFGIAGPLREAHEETKAECLAGMLGPHWRTDRIAADADHETEAEAAA
jgi:hypothetical protein